MQRPSDVPAHGLRKNLAHIRHPKTRGAITGAIANQEQTSRGHARRQGLEQALLRCDREIMKDIKDDHIPAKRGQLGRSDIVFA